MENNMKRTEENYAALLADKYVQELLLHEGLADSCRSVIGDIACYLFNSNSLDEGKKLERLIVLAKTQYGVSIATLIKKRIEPSLAWIESQEHHCGAEK